MRVVVVVVVWPGFPLRGGWGEGTMNIAIICASRILALPGSGAVRLPTRPLSLLQSGVRRWFSQKRDQGESSLHDGRASGQSPTLTPWMKGRPVGTRFLYSRYSSPKKWMREISSSSVRSRKKRHTVSA